MTPAFICAAVEVALNRTLRLEPEILTDLARLQGRVLGLRLLALDWGFFIEVIPGGVRVFSEWPDTPDVLLRGTPIALGRIAAHYARNEPGLPAGMDVEGDVELLSRFLRLLARVGLTAEELVAKVLGDSPAQRLVGGLKGLFGWGERSAKTLASNTSEYLREETYDLARKQDVDEWADAIDTLRDDAERLEARLARLERAGHE